MTINVLLEKPVILAHRQKNNFKIPQSVYTVIYAT